ncbi:MAG TPA: cyanophycin synthetase, partial [Ferruginibacter sp.]|nr:cyanophycin synthetase [Ferruginibacter sp.]
MKLLDLKVTRGPNYWSTYRQNLIMLKLDLEDYEQFPTNKISGFECRLEAMLPSLYEHECSENKPGGFFERVRQGTWLGHVIEHVALELQSIAGMPCGYGRTRSAGRDGLYHVVFEYIVEQAGIYAAHAAINLVEAIVKDEKYDLEKDIAELQYLNRRHGLGPSTQALVNEAKKRKIPYRRLDQNSLMLLGQGRNQKIICATTTGATSDIAVDMASNKAATKKLLAENYIPVPQGTVISKEEEIANAIREIGFPMVIKPLAGNHGRAVKLRISSEAEAIDAFRNAKEISRYVILERFIDGADYRFLLVNYKLQAVARRTPALVIGDNESTIAELIEKVNADEMRGEGHEKPLTSIKIDSITMSILNKKNLSLDSVLHFGEILFLQDAANLSSGGTATDVTDMVHPDNVFMAERIARLMNLDICGIDIIAEDITSPITKENGAVVEVNAGPGFRMHLLPSAGTPRNVAEPVLEMLFPNGSTGRIPVVAVTGTNGKTTTTRLIAHLATAAGHSVGYTTTEGISIQGQQVCHGDCSGPASAQVVLRDPVVDFAVLECARGGILRSGLGFDKCDISVITNVTEDHLGLDGIQTLRDLAKVKSVVARCTMDEGYAVLNADDDIVYRMRKDLDCNLAFFSVKENNPRMREHCKHGGIGAVIENGYFTVYKGEWRIRVAKIKDVPLTMNGKAGCMIKNILPAILVGVIRGFEMQVIRKALLSFVPGPELTPGRMNLFNFRGFDVMIDYAHNVDGFREIKEFMKQVKAPVKVGLIGVAGDRRDADIIAMGACAAEMFDEIIIRHDKDGRGRKDEEITSLFMQGILQTDPAMNPLVISDEESAIKYAVDNAKRG